jgi:hypothetical protein
MDKSLLEAALIGYGIEAERLAKAIGDLRARLAGSASPIPFAKQAKKRGMSAAARKRVSAAQKKRWAAWHKNHPKK